MENGKPLPFIEIGIECTETAQFRSSINTEKQPLARSGILASSGCRNIGPVGPGKDTYDAIVSDDMTAWKGGQRERF